MSFLAPLFLLGAAAVAAPVIFHLIRRTTRQRTPFSSLLFLPPSPPRVTQRSRLEDLLLLALRCLVLVLLTMGFARPFFRNGAPIDSGQRPPARTVILVDTSASMQRPGLWDAARARAVARARSAAPSDETALWVFDRDARALVTFEQWNATPVGDRAALVENRLAAEKPGWGATHLDTALTSAADALVEKADRPVIGARRIVLVSDLQQGSRLGSLQSFEWPKGVSVAIEPLKPRNRDNAGLQIIAETSMVPATTQAVVRVRVFNSGESSSDRFEVGWADPTGRGFRDRAESVQAAPGQSRTLRLAIPADGESTRILLRGDGQDFDNNAYLVPPRSAPVPMLYVGSDGPTEERQPLFFLKTAFPPSGRLAAAIMPVRPDQPLTADAVKSAALYFLTERVPAATAALLRDEISAGKTLVFTPKSADAFTSLAEILQAPGLRAEEAQVRNYAMFGTVDFQHPLLAPFADPRFSDFTKIHFWKYRRFDDAQLAGAHSVARFDSGDPAVVEVPLGNGRVFVFASTWRPDDSQLALSTKFVPLILSVAELGGALSAGPIQVYTVGDSLPVPAGAGGPASVRLPTGDEVALTVGQTNFSQTGVPGLYEIRAAGSAARFAVNLDSEETRTEMLPVETLESYGTPVGDTVDRPPISEVRRRHLAAAEAEGRQKIWRWLIVAALAALLIESAVAGRQGRRVMAGKEMLA